MTWRSLLLRAYPSSWRDEYGEEFAGLLAKRGLTFAVVADVLGGAVRQHLCRDEPWKICGAGLFLWTCLGMILDSYSLLTPASFQWYSVPAAAAWFGTATWTVWRRNTGIWDAVQKAYWAAIVGQVPDLLAWAVSGTGEPQLVYLYRSAPLSLLAWVVSGGAGEPRLVHLYRSAPFSLFGMAYVGAMAGCLIAGLREGLREHGGAS